MPRIFPPRFPYVNDPRRRAERRFFDSCVKQLDDSWIVLYEEEWIGSRNGRRNHGEIDFIVMHPTCGIILIEVKGGERIEVEHGEWFSVSHGSPKRNKIKNPFTQASDSKFVLHSFLEERLPQIEWGGKLGHLVVFPGHTQHGDMTVQGRRELICDRVDLEDLAAVFDRVANYFGLRNVLSDGEILAVKENLRPSFNLIGTSRIQYEDLRDGLDQLTDLQLSAYAMMRRHQRTVVHGGAGTGKTILAYHQAKELANDGLKTLYLCHSNPLASHLKQILGAEVDAVWKTNLRIDSLGSFVEPGWNFPLVNRIPVEIRQGRKVFWDINHLANYFLELSVNESNQWDAIILDEAQEMPWGEVEPVLLLLKDGGRRHVFGDPNQNLRWSESDFEGEQYLELSITPSLFHFVEDPIVLNVNCRSTKNIVRYANKISHSKVEDNFGVSGFPVHFEARSVAEWPGAIRRLCLKWFDEFGLDLSEITMLVQDGFVERHLNHLLSSREGAFSSECYSSFDDLLIDWYTGEGPLTKFGLLGRRLFEMIPDEPVWAPTGEPRPLVVPDDEWRNVLLAWDWSLLDPSLDSSDLLDESMRRERAEDPNDSFNEELRLHQSDVVPVVKVRNISNFIGLESEAVIALVGWDPDLTHSVVADVNKPVRQIPREVYTMATRARLLLGVICVPRLADRFLIDGTEL